jgi:hypothetical protein
MSLALVEKKMLVQEQEARLVVLVKLLMMERM